MCVPVPVCAAVLVAGVAVVLVWLLLLVWLLVGSAWWRWTVDHEIHCGVEFPGHLGLLRRDSDGLEPNLRHGGLDTKLGREGERLGSAR